VLLNISMWPLKKAPEKERDVQCSKHIARRDDIDSNVCVRPLHRKRARQMPHGRLGRIVRCLRLGHVDNMSRHGPDHHHTAPNLPFHQMLSEAGGPVVGAIEIDAHELVDPIGGVGNGIKVFGEACTGD